MEALSFRTLDSYSRLYQAADEAAEASAHVMKLYFLLAAQVVTAFLSWAALQDMYGVPGLAAVFVKTVLCATFSTAVASTGVTAALVIHFGLYPHLHTHRKH